MSSILYGASVVSKAYIHDHFEHFAFDTRCVGHESISYKYLKKIDSCRPIKKYNEYWITVVWSLNGEHHADWKYVCTMQHYAEQEACLQSEVLCSQNVDFACFQLLWDYEIYQNGK